MGTLTQTPLGSPVDYGEANETDLDITGATNVRNGGCSLYLLNMAAGAEDPSPLYAKFYDNDGSTLTLGTTAPDIIIPVKTATTCICIIPEGAAFTTGLSAAACSEDGNAITTAPDNDFDVTMITADA